MDAVKAMPLEGVKLRPPKWASTKSICFDLETFQRNQSERLFGGSLQGLENAKQGVSLNAPFVPDIHTFRLDEPYQSITVDSMKTRDLWRREGAYLQPEAAQFKQRELDRNNVTKLVESKGMQYQKPFTTYNPTIKELEAKPNFYVQCSSCEQGWMGLKRADPDGKEPRLMTAIKYGQLAEKSTDQIATEMRDYERGIDARLNGTLWKDRQVRMR